MPDTRITRLLAQAASVVMAAIALSSGSAAIAQTPCADCGQVMSIRIVEEAGRSSGLGAVAGGVLGGVLGNQIGGGTGRTVATIAGAGGGAMVGNSVERNRNTTSRWNVTIRMDAGNTRTFYYSSQPTVREGERVQLVDGGKRLALIAN